MCARCDITETTVLTWRIQPYGLGVGRFSSASPPEEVRTNIIAEIPVGRVGQPEDIARTVAFLTDDDAGYVQPFTEWRDVGS